MAENALSVENRDRVGKGVARRLRAAGRIPAVYYGKGERSVSVSLDSQALRLLLERSEAGMNTLIHLEGGAELDGKLVLVRELQRDPVRGRYLHADLFSVDVQKTVEVSVPIHLTGRAAGVELGGVLDQALRELDLECLPLAIPREVTVDVGALDIGDSLHIRDLDLPQGVTLRSDPDLSVVSVVAPAKAEEEVPEVEEAVEGELPTVEGEEAEEKSETTETREEKSDK